MDFSDDESEAVTQVVSNYYFVDDKDEPISFSELPVQWSDGETPHVTEKQIFLHGTTDNGLQKIYKQVVAWKFNLSDTKLEISVLSKENNWIKLQKPRKSFEDIIRTILITVHCLHVIKKNPETIGRALWDHLSKIFSMYEARPSQNDLVDHMSLISESVNKDKDLAESKYLATFLDEKPMKMKDLDEDAGNAAQNGFIVYDEILEEDSEDESEGVLFDSVCAICDNGGDLLCCEGRCLRSFHATEEAGAESQCDSLGFSDEQVATMQEWFCKNCQFKQHQCFCCGKLGSSDKSSGAEVFSCVSATCGHFYHPHCVSKLIHRDNEVEAKKLQEKIAAGEPFTCPIHKCSVCGQGENKLDSELQFAICRRCPKAYHRKCLPKKIKFDDSEDEDNVPRAWEGLIPNRILIYCLKHEIEDGLDTPARNHIKFPGVFQKREKQESKPPSSGGEVAREGKSLALKDPFVRKPLGKPQKGVNKLLPDIKQSESSTKSDGRLSKSDSWKKEKVVDTSRKLLSNSQSFKAQKLSTEESKTSLGKRLYDLISNDSEPNRPKKDDSTEGKFGQTGTLKLMGKEVDSSLLLDDDTKRRIMAIVQDAKSLITMEGLVKHDKMPTTHGYSMGTDRTITLGKVEVSVEALHEALKKLEEGCSIEDAKAVCEPTLLNQIIKWKNKLKVYLAPFLYGLRYTSFGRHFTKVDKLKEIVDRLHHYAREGDVIVDFCCGSNDFSCLMKKKLDETGKKCLYKNYDILQAKNDFNFEKRDWMTVQAKELPSGSQLIMGLNPPFGVNASLANKFIDKALDFKPKLLILIVPRETERLDKKKSPYDLVWEDDELLVGKTFYLPGSVDVNDKQMEDWNVNPPPLYLWSRPDWTARHKTVAEQHGHLSKVRGALPLEEVHDGVHTSDMLMDMHDHGEASKCESDHPVQIDEPKQPHERGGSATESHKEGFSHENREEECRQNHGHEKDPSDGSPKTSYGEGKRRRGEDKVLPGDRQSGRHSPSSLDGGRSSVTREKTAHVEAWKEGSKQFDQRWFSESQPQFQVGYNNVNEVDEIAGRYSLNTEEPYLNSAHQWTRTSSVPGPGPGHHAAWNSEEHYMGYRGEGSDTRGHGLYINEMDGRYEREVDTRVKIQLYGRADLDPLNQRSSSYIMGRDAGYSTSRGHFSSAADSSYGMLNTSAMQRYAPRLDELNHIRANNSSPQASSISRGAMYDFPAAQERRRADTLGFAPGPYRPFSQNNSSGWIRE